MKRIVTLEPYLADDQTSDEANRQEEWIQRAHKFSSVNEAEDWSFLRMFFPRRQETKAGVDESAE
jgi:hypothetical protein